MKWASPPATLRVCLAPRTRVLEHGRLMIGGSPGRLVRLHPRATGIIAGWQRGRSVGDDPAIRSLARRLLDAAVLVPDPDPGVETDLDVVIPTHGRPSQLDRCLEAVRRTAPRAGVTVIDDGSPDAKNIEHIALAHGAVVVTHTERQGPAAARNAGAGATNRPIIAFVDSDVVVEPGCLTRLAGTFSDPATGAVAPRVRSLAASGGAIADYEAAHSSLDMGPRANLVRPGSEVSYIPSTMVAVRRDAFGDGFDDQLQVGEDVDFIWRLCKAGWNVWYDPAVAVQHDHRTSLLGFGVRRFQYAASIGPLARRHPEALPAVPADTGSAIAALTIIGHPRLAASLSATLTIRRASHLRKHSDQPLRLSARLSAYAYYGASRRLAHAMRRVWWPLLAPMLLRNHRGRALLVYAWTIGLIEAQPAGPSQAALSIADDVIATLGTWWSCLTSRTVIPLRPARPAAQSSQRRPPL